MNSREFHPVTGVLLVPYWVRDHLQDRDYKTEVLLTEQMTEAISPQQFSDLMCIYNLSSPRMAISPKDILGNRSTHFVATTERLACEKSLSERFSSAVFSQEDSNRDKLSVDVPERFSVEQDMRVIIVLEEGLYPYPKDISDDIARLITSRFDYSMMARITNGALTRVNYRIDV